LRCYQWNMRFVEPHAQEERLARRRPTLQQSHCLIGAAHVGGPLVRPRVCLRRRLCAVTNRAEHVRACPQVCDPLRRRRRKRSVGLPSRQISKHLAVAILLFHHRLLAAGPRSWFRVVEDLPQQLDFVTALTEMLRQRDPIAIQQRRSCEIDGLGGRWIPPQQQRDPGRIAERKLAVGTIEADASACQAVQVRCSGHGVAVAADTAIEIVDGNEQHVRPSDRFCRIRRSENAA